MSSVFTKVRLGELPGQILFQDEVVFVIMTIAPHNPGHVLVIPVAETGNFEDLEQRIYERLMGVVRQMMHALKAVYDPPKVALIVSGADMPDHTHVHVLPQYKESDIDAASAKPAEHAELSQEAEKIRRYLAEHPIV